MMKSKDYRGALKCDMSRLFLAEVKGMLKIFSSEFDNTHKEDGYS